MKTIAKLDAAIRVVCPIHGVDSTGAISFADGATEAQMAAAQAVVATWVDDPAAEVKAALTAAVQAHLDATAQASGYDSIYTACTYADEPAVVQFQAEGQALRAWRSLVWAHCHGVMAAVQGATRPVPTAAELVAELPVLVMP